ncbi:MAG: cytochrome c2, partial [Rhodothermales bacterium]
MAAAGNQWTSTVIGLLAIVIALFFALSVGAFPANHPGADDGRVLLGELNCVACHDAGEIAGINWRQGPGLGEAGAQLKPEWLRLRLNSDLHGIMPDVLHGMPRAERAATVEDIVQFLASRGTLEAEVSAEPKDVKAGRNLYHTVGCVACHQPFELPATFFPKGSDAAAEDTVLPKLDSYSLTLYPQSRRTTTAKLAEFLAAPLYTHSSGRMPDLGLSADESRQIAAYLTSQEAPALPQEAATEFVADAAAAVRGAERFTALGCANCHTTEVNEPPAKLDLKALAATAKAFAAADSRSPGGEGPEKAIDNDPKTKYLNFGKLGSGLLITLPRQAVLSAITITSANDSPDRDPSAFKLEGSNDGETFAFITELGLQPFKDRFESQHISFRNTRAFTSYRFTVTKLRGNGLMQFAELQLFASRPPIPGVASTMTARPLAALNMNAKDGCLSAAPAAGRPRYVFTDIQRNAIRNAVATGKAGSPRQRVAETMRSFNCTACHERDGRRPDADRARYFTTTTAVDLGLEGRIPPSLTGVGSKLTEKGLGMLLLEGHRLRPHMATRMPRFGADNVGHLTTVFSQADGDGAAASEVALDRQTIKNGRGLVGVKGLACVNCHAWGGSKSLGVPGPDLVETVKRLEFDWFHRWL